MLQRLFVALALLPGLSRAQVRVSPVEVPALPDAGPASVPLDLPGPAAEPAMLPLSVERLGTELGTAIPLQGAASAPRSAAGSPASVTRIPPASRSMPAPRAVAQERTQEVVRDAVRAGPERANWTGLFDRSAFHSASVWDSPPADPQSEAARDEKAEAEGREAARLALEQLGTSRIAKPYVDFFHASPIPISIMSPTTKVDRVQPGQAALYDQIFARVDFNANVYRGADVHATARAMAPTLLHELKHHKTRIELGDVPLQENELEAYAVQAAYALEKMDEDPRWLETLPPAVRERYEDLLEAYAGGPQELSSFVVQRYIKVPSVFEDVAARLKQVTEELTVWRKRSENYEADKAALAEQAREAKKYDGLAGERVSLGPTRAQALAQAVRDYPLKEAIEHSVLKLADSVEFWSDPARIERNREHYRTAYQQLGADWKAWSDAHPGFRVRPPGALEKAWTAVRGALSWAWTKLCWLVNPPVVEPLFKISGGHFYHGTSWADLVAIVKGGGSLAAQVTYLSDNAGVSWGYARSRARSTWAKGIILQFPSGALNGSVGPGAMANPMVVLSGAPPSYGPRGSQAPYAYYYNARRDIPLSLMTPDSKETLLREAKALGDEAFLKELEKVLSPLP
jgi:hypothetical protein